MPYLTDATSLSLVDNPVYWIDAFAINAAFAPDSPGSTTTVGYALISSGENPLAEAYRPLSADEIANIETSLAAMSYGSGLRFVETSLEDAGIHIGASSVPSDDGSSVWYGRAFPSTTEATQVVAYDDPYDDPADLSRNLYIYPHELLHAVGLNHSTNAFHPEGSVVIPDDEARGTTLFGWWQEGWNTAEDRRLQLFDLAALQYLYGPDTTLRTGDDTYIPAMSVYDPLGDPLDQPLLWDGGGRDTLDLSAATGAINASLAPGHISRVGVDEGTSILEAGTFSINYNTRIEVLLGGTFADVLAAGPHDSEVRGGAGADRILSGAGNDLLFGDSGTDTFVFQEAWGGDVVTDPDQTGTIIFQNIRETELTFTTEAGDLLITAGVNQLRFTDYDSGAKSYAFQYETVDLNDRPTATARAADIAPGEEVSLSRLLEENGLFSWADEDGLDDVVSFSVVDQTGTGGYLFDGTFRRERADNIPIAEIGNWSFRAGNRGDRDYVGFAVTDAGGLTSDAVVAEVRTTGRFGDGLGVASPIWQSDLDAAGIDVAVHWTSYHEHGGIDFAGTDSDGDSFAGVPVRAAAGGTLYRAAVNPSGGLGEVVLIDHGDGYYSTYAHLSGYAAAFDDFRDAVANGTPLPEVRVNAGDIVGYVGATGRGSGTHLHFNIVSLPDSVTPLRTGSMGFTEAFSLFMWNEGESRADQFAKVQAVSAELALLADQPVHVVDFSDGTANTPNGRGTSTFSDIYYNFATIENHTPGSIERPRDNDWFRFHTRPGDTYEVTVTGEEVRNYRALEDPFFNVYGVNENTGQTYVIAESVEGEAREDQVGNVERLIFTAATGDEYYIAVSGGGDNFATLTGGYDVSVAIVTEREEVAADADGNVTAGTTADERLATSDDAVEIMRGGGGSDLFVFSADAGDGVRQRISIFDFDPENDVIALGTATAHTTRAIGQSVEITMVGDNADTLLVMGVTTVDEIEFV